MKFALCFAVLMSVAFSSEAKTATFKSYAGPVALPTVRYKAKLPRQYKACRPISRKVLYRKTGLMFNRYIKSGLVCRQQGQTTYVAIVR